MIYITANTAPAYAEANAQPMVMYRNLLAEGTLANIAAPAGAPRANAVTESTFDFWLADADPQVLQTTLAGAETADCAFFAAHSLGSTGATITVQYFDGSLWQTQAVATPADDQPFAMIWPARSATGWGVQISGGLAQIGVAWVGQRLVIPGGVLPDYAPVWASRVITKLSGASRRGQWFGQRTERTGAKLSASFMPIPHSFALNDLRAFRDHYNEGRAFVWAPAPGVFGEDVAYAWAPEGAVFAPRILAGGELVSLSLDMEAFAEPTT